MSDQQNINVSTACTPKNTGISEPADNQPKKRPQRRKVREKTIFTSPQIIKKDLKHATSSEIKAVIEMLSSAYEEKLTQENAEKALFELQQKQALDLISQAKELGLPLEVLKKAIS